MAGIGLFIQTWCARLRWLCMCTLDRRHLSASRGLHATTSSQTIRKRHRSIANGQSDKRNSRNFCFVVGMGMKTHNNTFLILRMYIVFMFVYTCKMYGKQDVKPIQTMMQFLQRRRFSLREKIHTLHTFLVFVFVCLQNCKRWLLFFLTFPKH